MPQTRNSLAENKTDLVKLNRRINNLLRRELISKRYYRIKNNSKNTVYVPFNFKGFLLSYSFENCKKLIYFEKFMKKRFSLFVPELYIYNLESKKWDLIKNTYIDKNKVEEF